MTVATAAKPTAPVKGMSLADVIEAGEALAKEWGPRAEEAEQLRRMPPGFADSIEALGVMPMVRPARYGGFEQDWVALAEFVRPIAKYSGSMAWCGSFLLQHQWALSHHPVETQDEVYATDPNPRIVTSLAFQGEVEPVPGGYKVKGEWAFGSGGDQCNWAFVGGMVKQEGAPPKPVYVLLRKDQFWMRDVWRSTGLKASGSNNIVVEETFVKEGWVLDATAAREGRHPSLGLSDSPIFTSGMGVQFQIALAMPLLATCDGLLESFLSYYKDQQGYYMPGKKAEDPNTQLRVGEAAADFATARTVLYNINRQVMADELHGLEGAAKFMRDIPLMGKLSLSGADKLFTLSGARGLNESNLFGRHWRDVHAMSNHAGLASDPFLKMYGSYLLTGKLMG
jgi:3-hydroxy-9,10-secoandrosta-1,3,5(10)-triene-9,17-dione monooxygenase